MLSISRNIRTPSLTGFIFECETVVGMTIWNIPGPMGRLACADSLLLSPLLSGYHAVQPVPQDFHIAQVFPVHKPSRYEFCPADQFPRQHAVLDASAENDIMAFGSSARTAQIHQRRRRREIVEKRINDQDAWRTCSACRSSVRRYRQDSDFAAATIRASQNDS